MFHATRALCSTYAAETDSASPQDVDAAIKRGVATHPALAENRNSENEQMCSSRKSAAGAGGLPTAGFAARKLAMVFAVRESSSTVMVSNEPVCTNAHARAPAAVAPTAAKSATGVNLQLPEALTKECALGQLCLSDGKERSHHTMMYSTTIDLDTKHVGPSTTKRLHTRELQELRAHAASDYRIIKNRTEVMDLYREETIVREQIEDDARHLLEALFTWQAEERSTLRTGGQESSSFALQRLQRRLLDRQRVLHAAHVEKEARLREEGRRAWLAEAEAQRKHEAEVVEWRRRQKEEEDQFRAAVTFIIVHERSSRAEVEKEEAAVLVTIRQQATEAAAEVERIAYENFINSPEQLALAAEREAKAVKARKRAARMQKARQVQQQKFIKNCHHGRNGTSMFEGPTARTVCQRCRVQYDEELGYYVNMDAAKPSTKSRKQSSATSVAKTSRTQSKSDGRKRSARALSAVAEEGNSKETPGESKSAGKKPQRRFSTTSVAKKKGSSVVIADEVGSKEEKARKPSTTVQLQTPFSSPIEISKIAAAA